METHCIYIRDLRLRCIIGVFPHERKARQDLRINVKMECDFGKAAQSDELEDTVNYKELNKQVIKMVEESSFNLIESLADRTAEICLAHPKVHRVTVSVDKPGALRFADSVAVEITRSR